ncbi:hypothetical protein J7I94_07045 [Streptomyces sp. ISL-12]|uniref:hypothetical protein n=1 Tax=Streptomyces sp. ISL-12 TaxID=2819177 RepID=UPI001BE90CFB|nr:hypothetical protein [Streptomyces sp. ISL-12]MBT2410314.1 hypothetical protein [Streptomyces sp. ISL-12]
MTDSLGTPRRLPWTGPDGKPAYLLTDGTGPLSRLVDAVDAQQLEMAGRLLDHAADILDDDSATSDQLRYLLTCMYDALTDVHRIAEHRHGAAR